MVLQMLAPHVQLDCFFMLLPVNQLVLLAFMVITQQIFAKYAITFPIAPVANLAIIWKNQRTHQ
jgi:hypothetical protein